MEINNKLSGTFTFASLLKFSLPTMIMMIFMSLYTMVDGIFVSRLVGTDALSAVNIVYPILSVVIAVSVMYATGASAIVARKMGEGNSKEAKQDFTFIVLVGFLTGLAITILGLLFLDPILRFLGADSTIYTLCRDYAIPLLLFTVPGVFQMLFQTFFVTAGHPMIGLIVTLLGGIANIVFDYVFIAIFDWGIAGAAIATGIGFSIPALFGLVWFSIQRKGTLFFVVPVWRVKVLLYTMLNGSSEMVTNLSTAIVTYLFNTFMMRFLGVDGVAAITIVLYAEYLLVALYLGYATGIAPILSYNHGEKNIVQLKKLFKMSMWFVAVTSLAILAGAYLLAPTIVGVFAPRGSNVFQLAVHGFYLYSICFIFKGINIFASGMFTALSDGKTSAALSFLRTLVFIVLGLLFLPKFLEVDGIWLAVPFAEFLSVFFAVLCFRRQFKTRWNILENGVSALPKK